MGDLSNNIKKILSNKNTVTVVGIVLIIVVLYFAYNFRVNQATQPISVPYANSLISPGVQITEDMVGTTEITKSMLNKIGAKQNYNEIIGKYSNTDSVIPKGSLFYEKNIIEKQMISSNGLKTPEGYVPYHLDNVSIDTTYGNAMFPGNYIDIYLKIVQKQTNSKQQQSDYIRFSKLFEDIKIVAVKDGAGSDVFADLDDVKTPSMLIFNLPEEYYTILRKCENLTGLQATIVPVPTNESLEESPSEEVKIADKDLVKYINDNTLVR